MSFLWFSPFESDFAMIIWGLFLGASIGLIYILSSNRKKAKSIALMKIKEAFSEDTASMFSDLGFAGLDEAEKVLSSFTNEIGGRFYIPESKMKKAEFIEKCGKAKPIVIILSIVAFYVLLLLIHKFLPMLINIG